MTAHIEKQIPQRLYLHWTGVGNYRQLFTDYHCSVQNWLGVARVVHVHPYTKALHHHTYKRNTNAVAISCCGGVEGYPITRGQVEKMCEEAAKVCIKYHIPPDSYHVKTHAESAQEVGYYPERVDFDGQGDTLRGKIRWYIQKLTSGGFDPDSFGY